MFQRLIAQQLVKELDQAGVLVLTGPRQSGKTTLLKTLFPNRRYINLEAPDVLERVQADPRGFFRDPHQQWIIDEAQRFPELFSYLQVFVDEGRPKGTFILSGSQNFLLMEKISQSLAGRCTICELLPLTYEEYGTHPKATPLDLWDFIYKGQYPRPYHEHLDVHRWYQNYILTYVEKDVRNLLNVKDAGKFQTFLRLCAGRHGQLLNLNALAQECGITQPTANHWISLLEQSYLVFRLQPYHRNFNKRIVKTPKLYFYDSGIVCALLGIESPQHLEMHSARGALFEGFVLSELLKYRRAHLIQHPLYFWRDHAGQEIDVIMETKTGLKALEIKSSMTFQGAFIRILDKFAQLTPIEKIIVYGGNDAFDFQEAHVVSWKDLGTL